MSSKHSPGFSRDRPIANARELRLTSSRSTVVTHTVELFALLNGCPHSHRVAAVCTARLSYLRVWHIWLVSMFRPHVAKAHNRCCASSSRDLKHPTTRGNWQSHDICTAIRGRLDVRHRITCEQILIMFFIETLRQVSYTSNLPKYLQS